MKPYSEIRSKKMKDFLVGRTIKDVRAFYNRDGLDITSVELVLDNKAVINICPGCKQEDGINSISIYPLS